LKVEVEEFLTESRLLYDSLMQRCFHKRI